MDWKLKLLQKILENLKLGKVVEIITKEEEDILVEVASTIIMPPKLVKRGQQKGAEMTAIGLPSKKKTKFANKNQ